MNGEKIFVSLVCMGISASAATKTLGNEGALPPAGGMAAIFDDLRERWKPLEKGFAYDGHTSQVDYLTALIGEDRRAVGIQPRNTPAVADATIQLASFGNDYTVHITLNGATQIYHAGPDRGVWLGVDGQVKTVSDRTSSFEESEIPFGFFTPKRLLDEWLDFPRPKKFLRADATIERHVVKNTAEELVEDVVMKHTNVVGEHFEEHEEFVAKPFAALGWLPVEIRRITKAKVIRRFSIDWVDIPVRGSSAIPIPCSYEQANYARDPNHGGDYTLASTQRCSLDPKTFNVAADTNPGDAASLTPWDEVAKLEASLNGKSLMGPLEARSKLSSVLLPFAAMVAICSIAYWYLRNRASLRHPPTA